MRRIRAALATIIGIPGAIAGAVRGVVEPLRPEPGTTEAAQYFALILIAAGFVVAGRPELALIVPGVWIGILASAPVIVGILRRGG